MKQIIEKELSKKIQISLGATNFYQKRTARLFGFAVNYQEMIYIKWALSLRQTRRGISLQNTQA